MVVFLLNRMWQNRCLSARILFLHPGNILLDQIARLLLSIFTTTNLLSQTTTILGLSLPTGQLGVSGWKSELLGAVWIVLVEVLLDAGWALSSRQVVVGICVLLLKLLLLRFVILWFDARLLRRRVIVPWQDRLLRGILRVLEYLRKVIVASVLSSRMVVQLSVLDVVFGFGGRHLRKLFVLDSWRSWWSLSSVVLVGVRVEYLTLVEGGLCVARIGHVMRWLLSNHMILLV